MKMTELLNRITLGLVFKLAIISLVLWLLLRLGQTVLLFSKIDILKITINNCILPIESYTNPTEAYITQYKLIKLLRLYETLYRTNVIELCSGPETNLLRHEMEIRQEVLPWYKKYQSHNVYLCQNMDSVHFDDN